MTTPATNLADDVEDALRAGINFALIAAGTCTEAEEEAAFHARRGEIEQTLEKFREWRTPTKIDLSEK